MLSTAAMAWLTASAACCRRSTGVACRRSGVGEGEAGGGLRACLLAVVHRGHKRGRARLVAQQTAELLPLWRAGCESVEEVLNLRAATHTT